MSLAPAVVLQFTFPYPAIAGAKEAILIAGGLSNNHKVLASAELYDPVARSFRLTGAMTIPRYGYSATVLTSRQVLIAGGISSGGAPVNSAELYDPATRSFVLTGSMNIARAFQSATLLRNGEVLVAGCTNLCHANAELYDPVKGVFTQTGGLINAEVLSSASALLPDGNVLLTGVLTELNAPAQLYESAIKTFAAIDLPYSSAGVFGTATWLDPQYVHGTESGEVLTVGGGFALVLTPCPADLSSALSPFGGYSSTKSALLYLPADRRFQRTGEMAFARMLHTATLLDNGQVLVAGGTAGRCMLGAFRSAELYDPQTGTFSTAANMMFSRAGHIAILLPDGDVLLAGGVDNKGTVLRSAELYEPSTGLFEAVPPMRHPRALMTAVPIMVPSRENSSSN